MSNKFFVIKVIHRGSVISLKVPLLGKKWSWVAAEVLRLHLISMDEEQRKDFLSLRISGILSPSREPLNLTQNIMYYDVFEYGIFELLSDGPWVMLEDTHLLSILEYLPGIKDLRSLMGVSKRFKKLFSSDTGRGTEITMFTHTFILPILPIHTYTHSYIHTLIHKVYAH
jgi:hypothetical protein